VKEPNGVVSLRAALQTPSGEETQTMCRSAVPFAGSLIDSSPIKPSANQVIFAGPTVHLGVKTSPNLYFRTAPLLVTGPYAWLQLDRPHYESAAAQPLGPDPN
jgi:hypothetical protein